MTTTRIALKPSLALAAASLMLATLSGVALGATTAPQTSGWTASAEENASYFTAEPFQSDDAPSIPTAKRTVSKPQAAVLADIPRDLEVTAQPGGRKVIGIMPGGSKFFDEPIKAWILHKTPDGRYGKVTLPYSGSRATGWIPLAGLNLSATSYSVQVDLSKHSVKVMRFDKVIMSFPAATGAADSPTPTGRFFVTDLVDIPPGGSFGSFAFGLSGIQPNLPQGWTGGDQLAIHGTQDPSSIGTSASAGCLRVSERALTKLKRFVDLGTPVTITK